MKLKVAKSAQLIVQKKEEKMRKSWFFADFYFHSFSLFFALIVFSNVGGNL